MKVAMITTDAREHWREYHKTDPYFGTPQEALFKGVPDVPDLELHVVSCWQKPMQAPQKLAPNIWFHSLLVPKIGWMRTGYQGCIRAVRRKMKELQPDLVHGQGTERDCAISAALSGFPSLVTVHGNMAAIAKVVKSRPFTYTWLAARVEEWTLPRANGVICLTRYAREQVGSRARHSWVLPNAVDPSFFAINNSPVQPAHIVCVGHIQERKNQVRLLQALDPVASRMQFTVTFYGRTAPGDRYGKQVVEMIQQRPWCRHAGFADHATVKAALQSATMLVLPSLEENCPMTVLEAMAAGLPVVAANAGGIPDLFEDGVSGLFCDPLDLESIRGAIQRLLTQPALAAQVASQARKRALQSFHPKVIARGHVNIYRDLLRRSGPVA